MTPDQIFEEADPHSIMGQKLRPLIAAARTCADVPGSVAEVGVYKGGSGLALCRCFEEKVVYLIDTFSGIPADDECGEHRKGDFSDTSSDAAVALLMNREVHNGFVLPWNICHEESTRRFDMHRPFAFVHLDCDILQSTKAAAEFFVPRLSPLGGIFFDDYHNTRTPGVKLVVDELLASGRFRAEIDGQHGTAFLKLV